jgi:antitoxin FitA
MSLHMHCTCKYHHHMSKMIQIRHVPDDLHRRLKARAAMVGLSLSDYLLEEIERMAEIPSLHEWMRRVATREPAKLKRSLAATIRAERRGR